MQQLSIKNLQIRSAFIKHVRHYFNAKDILEIETPLLNTTPTVEAHLDSFRVERPGIRKSPDAPALTDNQKKTGYLITSPEYNLKKVVSHHQQSIFQIAHCFREGDIGDWHSEEFLMLEWYLVHHKIEDLMDFCDDFLNSCNALDFTSVAYKTAERLQVAELFQHYLAICTSYDSLIRYIVDQKLFTGDVSTLAYDDAFFLIFLNCIEPHLKQRNVFLYDYPPELAALSCLQDGKAKRFEIYMNNVELANGYQELRTAHEYKVAFTRENQQRSELGKNLAEADQELLQELERSGGLPVCSGIALGLERLLATLLGHSNIASISPFQNNLQSDLLQNQSST